MLLNFTDDDEKKSGETEQQQAELTNRRLGSKQCLYALREAGDVQDTDSSHTDGNYEFHDLEIAVVC